MLFRHVKPTFFRNSCAGEDKCVAAQVCQEVPFAGWYGIGKEWEDVSQSSPWGMRGGFGFAVMGGRLAVFGGEDSAGTLHNDVFVTRDGMSWTSLHTTSAWKARTNFLHFVHEEYLYVMSGRGCDDYCNDIYRAPAPSVGNFQLSFERVGDLPRPGRERGLAVSFQGRIYDIGGCSASGCFVDIIMLEPTVSGQWHSVSVVEPTCEIPKGCIWTIDFVGQWPNTLEYRLVGAAHTDSIYIFGGRVSTSVLRLTPSSSGAGDN